MPKYKKVMWKSRLKPLFRKDMTPKEVSDTIYAKALAPTNAIVLNNHKMRSDNLRTVKEDCKKRIKLIEEKVKELTKLLDPKAEDVKPQDIEGIRKRVNLEAAVIKEKYELLKKEAFDYATCFNTDGYRGSTLMKHIQTAGTDAKIPKGFDWKTVEKNLAKGLAVRERVIGDDRTLTSHTGRVKQYAERALALNKAVIKMTAKGKEKLALQLKAQKTLKAEAADLKKLTYDKSGPVQVAIRQIVEDAERIESFCANEKLKADAVIKFLTAKIPDLEAKRKKLSGLVKTARTQHKGLVKRFGDKKWAAEHLRGTNSAVELAEQKRPALEKRAIDACIRGSQRIEALKKTLGA